MTDKELMKQIAVLWVDNGGDVEGVDWTIHLLKDAIAEEIDRREKDE